MNPRLLIKPQIIRRPLFAFIDELEIKLPQDLRYELMHLADGDLYHVSESKSGVRHPKLE